MITLTTKHTSWWPMGHLGGTGCKTPAGRGPQESPNGPPKLQGYPNSCRGQGPKIAQMGHHSCQGSQDPCNPPPPQARHPLDRPTKMVPLLASCCKKFTWEKHEFKDIIPLVCGGCKPPSNAEANSWSRERGPGPRKKMHSNGYRWSTESAHVGLNPPQMRRVDLQ